MNFPHLYECSECGKPVKVTPVENAEPIIKRTCAHDAPIYANRKVTLRGEGKLNVIKSSSIKLTLTVRQFLSYLTGRSI
jgi:hypothetical protein